MANERGELRRRDTNGSTSQHRQTGSQDRPNIPLTALPMLDWPRDLFNRAEAMIPANLDQ